MGNPHVHAAVIKEWADGAAVQARVEPGGDWIDVVNPVFDEGTEYRVKPEADPLETTMNPAYLHAEYLKALLDAGPTYYAGFVAIANAALRHAVDTDQLVPMAKVKEVARALASRDRTARDLAIAGAVQRACEDQASGSLPFLPVFALDLQSIIDGVKP